MFGDINLVRDMKIKLAMLVQVLAILGALFFAPQAWAVIVCSSAQLKNPDLKTYCDAQQALIDQQRIKNKALLDALRKKTAKSPN